MATAEETRVTQTEQRILIRNVEWETYETFLSALGDHSSVRLSFYRGDLELTSSSPAHEYYKRMVGRLISQIAHEMRLSVREGGSTTFKREDMQAGLEPDECYWIAHESAVRGKLDLDLHTDPPPDLAVEIDMTRSSLNRRQLYATLGVPELWRFDGETLHAYVLQANGEYASSKTSACFPFLTVNDLVPFLRPDEQTAPATRHYQFVAWLRERLPQF